MSYLDDADLDKKRAGNFPQPLVLLASFLYLPRAIAPEKPKKRERAKILEKPKKEERATVREKPIDIERGRGA